MAFLVSQEQISSVCSEVQGMVFPKTALLSVPVVPGQWHQPSVGAGTSGCSRSSCCDTELNQTDPDWDGKVLGRGTGSQPLSEEESWSRMAGAGA